MPPLPICAAGGVPPLPIRAHSLFVTHNIARVLYLVRRGLVFTILINYVRYVRVLPVGGVPPLPIRAHSLFVTHNIARVLHLVRCGLVFMILINYVCVLPADTSIAHRAITIKGVVPGTTGHAC